MQRVRGIGESKMHDLFYKQRIPEIVNAHPAIIFFSAFIRTRCDQTVIGPICFGEIHFIKIFVSRSFELIERIGSVNSMRSCLVAYVKLF